MVKRRLEIVWLKQKKKKMDQSLKKFFLESSISGDSNADGIIR